MLALVAACGGGGGNGEESASSNSPAFTVATATPAPPATPTPTLEEVLRSFVYPIREGCLPQGSQLMPNAPREYRLGTHEGVDFYNVDNCTPITLGTEVVAVKEGRIIRIDHDYRDPTSQEMQSLLADPDTEESLDAFRGRQVWIDHGGGVVTRYCHLATVAEGLQVDQVVAQGTVVGTVGESGTPESIDNPGTQYHLHWEVRIGDTYLGANQPADQVRAQYEALFQ
jgi:murein DD-endopeptidase MepM/ murein hydrolase activator NlpD